MYLFELGSKMFKPVSSLYQAQLTGDQGAVEVLEAAEQSVEKEVANEMDDLVEKQIERQADLEISQQKAVAEMTEEMDAVLATNEKEISSQIEEQKKKVMGGCIARRSFCEEFD